MVVSTTNKTDILVPSPEEVAQQLLAKMSREGKELLEKISAYLQPENGEIQLIPKGPNKYRFPLSKLGYDFNELSEAERDRLIKFVQLSGWTHLYTTFDRWSFGDGEALVIEKRRTWRERFADILK